MGCRVVKNTNQNDIMLCNICKDKVATYNIKSNIMTKGDHYTCDKCLEIEQKWLKSVNMYHTFIILDKY